MTPSGPADQTKDQAPDALLRLVADSVPALMAYYDTATVRCRFANRRYAEYNGWTPETILGRPLEEVIGPQAYALIAPHVAKVMAGETVRYVREQTLPDGGKRMIEVSLIPHFAEGDGQVGAFVLINDITDQWRAERAIRESELRMRRFADATEEGIVFHKGGVITDANAALLHLIGCELDELVGHKILDFVAEPWRHTVREYMRVEGEAPYEAEVLHKSGRRIPVEIVGRSMPHAGQTYRMAVVRDITGRRQAQARIEFLALHDVLTQLPNRHYLMEHLGRLTARARRQRSQVAVLFVDLDGFKQINDTQGHALGDQLLRQVADRLKLAVRQSDLVARLGGDEFLVVLGDVDTRADASRVAQNVLDALRPPLHAAGMRHQLSASIGISLYPGDGESADELIGRADKAMYQVKRAGGSAYRFFNAEMLDQAGD